MESPWSRFLVRLVVITAVLHTLLFAYSVGLETRKRPPVIVIGGSGSSLEPRFSDTSEFLVRTPFEISEFVYNALRLARRVDEIATSFTEIGAFETAPGVISQSGSSCSSNSLSINLMFCQLTDVSLTSDISNDWMQRADCERLQR
jgi:hypothetical protein